MKWSVCFSNSALKCYEKLKRSGQKKPSIVDLVDLLALELQRFGPDRVDWPNYGKLSKDTYHCHLKKGRPTYVACWRANNTLKEIEVYYVGSHEGVPY